MPSEFVFEPRSLRYGPFLVSGCWCTWRRFWGFWAPFWAVSRTYRGVRGQQRSLGHEKLKPHMECSSRLPSFGCFGPVLGLFWAKNGCFLAQNCADLGGHLPTWRHRPGPPPGSLWLKNWIRQGHDLGSGMATQAKDPKRWDGAMAETTRRRVVVACLLARFKLSPRKLHPPFGREGPKK